MKRVFLLFLLLALYSCKNTSGGDMDIYQNCPLEGDAKRPDVRYLNILKNRYKIPDSTDFDRSVTLQAMLAPGNDKNRFSDRKAVDIKGYVYDVKVGGNESCNCHERNPQYRDTHIELVLSLDNEEKECVIVEITPRIREVMAQKGKDWTTDNIRRTFKGQYVEVQGWLLFDEEHLNQAENTDPDNPKDWRATCWEVHPVTSIELVDVRS